MKKILVMLVCVSVVVFLMLISIAHAERIKFIKCDICGKKATYTYWEAQVDNEYAPKHVCLDCIKILVTLSECKKKATISRLEGEK